MRTLGYRAQRTLANSTEIAGTGFITGARVRLRFMPAAEDHGLAFVRTDLPGSPIIRAVVSSVTDTRRRTTLGPAKSGVTLVEHVLAALAGIRIDNCRIELDGPEPPGLDGSACEFVNAIKAAGIAHQTAQRPIRTVTARTMVEKDGATIAFHPAEGMSLRASYILDYGPLSPIPRQSATLSVTPESFARDVANCRTFLLESEAHQLRSQGIGQHLKASEVLVFGPHGPLDNRLRYGDEPARHKLLDLLGDLALCGFDLAGHVVAYRSGHGLNVELASDLARRTVTERADAPAVLPFRSLNRKAA
jgi:UDP-3-O-acyl N-acetylglucosamine deacetylase